VRTGEDHKSALVRTRQHADRKQKKNRDVSCDFGENERWIQGRFFKARGVLGSFPEFWLVLARLCVGRFGRLITLVRTKMNP